MSTFIAPRFDNGIIAIRLGELFGIDPHKIADYHAESYGGHADPSNGSPDQVMVTIKAKMRISYEQFNAILREATIRTEP